MFKLTWVLLSVVVGIMFTWKQTWYCIVLYCIDCGCIDSCCIDFDYDLEHDNILTPPVFLIFITDESEDTWHLLAAGA